MLGSAVSHNHSNLEAGAAIHTHKKLIVVHLHALNIQETVMSFLAIQAALAPGIMSYKVAAHASWNGAVSAQSGYYGMHKRRHWSSKLKAVIV